MSFFRALLPRACPGCGQDLGVRAGVCDACLASLRPDLSAHSLLRPDPKPHLVSLGPYEGRVRRLVRALKYEGSRELAARLAVTLATGVPAGWALDAVTAVPLHASRRRERGFNQAESLARAVANELNVPYRDLLERVRATRQQARLSGSERAKNVEGAFRANGPVPARVLLIDDVLTTSRTLGACVRELRFAGAAEVYVLVLAR